MIEQSDNKLTIIKASAGSGKTYRIALEYINLLLKNPRSFSNILAVTFTNKATAEMKSRIIQNLHLIAKNDPEVADLITELVKKSHLSPNEIQKSASTTLQNILHEYQNFTVTTIDHFFQKIIRALTRELNIGGAYTIQLDHSVIIEEAIQNLLNDVKPDTELMNVLLDFIDSQMNDDKSWNIQYQLTNFTNQLFREQVRHYFVKNNNKLTSDNTYKEAITDLNSTIKNFKFSLLQFSKNVEAIMEKAKIEPEDLAGKSRNPLISIINHLKKGNYTKAIEVFPKLEEVKEWGHSKSTKRDLVNSLLPEINALIKQLQTIIDEQYPIYLESMAILPNFYQHALASHLMHKVTEVLLNQNLFMLSDAPIVLSLLTGDHDAPFIYEKTGHRFKHFMIDEFQDTSALQWQNFKPLIIESLANNNEGNFIVGDVKQAIYRWRNGDWSLLHSKVAQDIPNCETEPLNNNYRSKENIVNFNNFLFEKATLQIANELTEPQKLELVKMYEDVIQSIPKSLENKRQGGYVHIQSIEGKVVDKFKSAALDAMTEQIKRLRHEHNQTDICVLVRKNNEVSLVASHLIQNNFKIVSSGSLALQNSDLVLLIINTFRYLALHDNIYLTAVKYAYQKKQNLELHTIFAEHTTNFFPDEFTRQAPNIAKLAPLQAITKIIELLKLKEIYPNQDVFLCKLYNEIKKVSAKNGNNLKTIIDWWEVEGANINVDITETDPTSIQIITLHKSKGLQFKNVVIPFAQWSPPKTPGTLWIDGTHFNLKTLQNGFYPANLKKEHLACPNLATFYADETFANIVDQFNMLYVATTRAKDNLFICYWDKPDKNDVSAWIKHAINAKTNNPIIESGHWLSDNTLIYGKLATQKIEPENQSKSNINIDFNSELQLKIKSNIYEFTHQADYTATQTSKGSLLHRIFEQIITSNDVDRAIMKHISNGMLKPDEGKTLTDKINTWIKLPTVNQWFLPGNKILTESEIIIPKTENRRPDRVIITKTQTIVIDYKFGKIDKTRHSKQVSEYIDLLKQMDYKNIIGYVWYPVQQEILTINR